MFEKKDSNSEQNFWISYADLMAGLLFVFILLVGAIVVKYVYSQSNLDQMRMDLAKEKEALNMSDEALDKKKKALNSIQEKLKISQQESLHLSFEIAKARNIMEKNKEKLAKIKKANEKLNRELLQNVAQLQRSSNTIMQKDKDIEQLQESKDAMAKNLEQTSNNLESSRALIENNNQSIDELNQKNKKLTSALDINLKDLQLSAEQIVKMTTILEDKKNKIVLLDTEIEAQKNRIATKIEELSLNKEEIEKLKDLLLGYELRQKEYIQKNTTLTQAVQTGQNAITLKDDELGLLEQKLLIQSKEHQALVEEFDITKVKIKNLTGVRIKVVTSLRDKLGSSIDIDPKSGAMRFSSNILFEKGQYVLKDDAKKQLSGILKKYLHTLLLNEDIRQYIDNIIIEGYTDSVGSYLYNLELSQKRALEVMKFLHTLKFEQKELLEQYISASGRSFSDLIYENGEENKDASRRIEIKFRIKNEKAIKELENFLQR